jgi:sugar lactone lactonase YvrE
MEKKSKHLVIKYSVAAGIFYVGAVFSDNTIYTDCLQNTQFGIDARNFLNTCNDACSAHYAHNYELDVNTINFSKVIEIEPLTPGFAIFEGPIWIEDGLVMSHIGYAVDKTPNPSNLVVYRDGEIKVLQEGYGSNGLTYDAKGYLVAARHLDGSVTRVINGKVIASKIGGDRFNSPNDLVFSSSGDLYFTDPSWQNPEPTQQDELAYHVKTNGEVYPFAANIDRPNGVMLSQYEDHIYVGGTNGLFKFPLHQNGVVQDTPVQVAANTISEGVDGMSRDCAGNIYVVADGKVHILDGIADTILASYKIEGATNIAFGGKNNMTIYVTTMGANPQVWKSETNIPGLPY